MDPTTPTSAGPWGSVLEQVTHDILLSPSEGVTKPCGSHLGLSVTPSGGWVVCPAGSKASKRCMSLHSLILDCSTNSVSVSQRQKDTYSAVLSLNCPPKTCSWMTELGWTLLTACSMIT